MNNRIVRTATVAGIGALSLLGAAAAPGMAAAAPHMTDPAKLAIDGDLMIAPGVHLLNIEAQGARDMDGKTHGTYVATIMDGMHKTPFQVKGPVTCIWTHGDTASLVYPITETSPNIVPAQLSGAYAVKISVRKGSGMMNEVGVMGPMATSSFHGCAPGATPNMFHGDVMIG
ncbi:hypothetical protein ACE11G_11025 [Gordonia sp. PS3]|uniref:Uncharacterized protein n=1 Tax=Gordonia sihwensis NBRC 108236 TaxID=1223544 RepID=L7LK02_9ACTN|nr:MULTISPECIES: hypothetical protein [Gordonia]AUH69366.1 hypothetical protein CXX93_14775 [Gordonia sp. YC-JH1]MBY4571759.1 hypothetical protein [Gordonia sihwensis]WFN94316.1 hypothetical protein P5P27_07150 [Gordonia sihwensis]GAC61204.1 hypothetical protein GSI01S_15_00740 [Gordonia sihwensis NBRC 108236]